MRNIIPHYRAVLIVSQSDKDRFSYVYKLASSLGIQDMITWQQSVPYQDLPYWIAAVHHTVVPSLAE